MTNQKRTNPDFDRLSDLVYLSSLEKLEAAIRDEGHTAAELSEALSEFVEEFERSIRELTADISRLVSDREDIRARWRVLLSVKKKIETEDWVD